MARVFIPRERRPGETRVAATPEIAHKLTDAGFEVLVEAGAGSGAHFLDDAYVKAGASVVDGAGAEAAWGSEAVLTVRGPSPDQVPRLAEGGLLVGFLSPYDQPELVDALAERKVSSLAMELVPRISRAQSMDALSSQASIAGYKAVLLAAATLGRYFPLLMTAAGTISPARVVVMGAGVAGLQAVATARRLGAVVEVSDIRPAVEEQVKSLGGKFIPLPDMGESGEGEGGYARQVTEDFLTRQREIVAKHLSQAQVVVTTALVPGKRAPKLVTEAMVEAMEPGAVIVDLAVEQGGNCELSRADETVEAHGVTILGPSNLAATMAHDASTLFARNVHALLGLVIRKGEEGGPASLTLDREDEVIAGTLLTHGGDLVHERVAGILRPGAAPKPSPEAPAPPPSATENPPQEVARS